MAKDLAIAAIVCKSLCSLILTFLARVTPVGTASSSSLIFLLWMITVAGLAEVHIMRRVLLKDG